MAITYTVDTIDSNANTATITSSTLTVLSTSVIVALYVHENNDDAGALTISNSGTALTWTNIATTNTTNNCKSAGWWAFGDSNGNRTVTVTKANVFTHRRRLNSIVHEGAHATTPVPVGKVLSGVGGTDISNSMTPTDANGSALWLNLGDWNATNSFAAATNCTLESTFHDAATYTTTLVRPTTQPRTDGSAFSLGETDTSGKMAWIAFEVVAAAGAGDTLFGSQEIRFI